MESWFWLQLASEVKTEVAVEVLAEEAAKGEKCRQARPLLE